MPSEESESQSFEAYVDNYPVPINNTECVHRYVLEFTDSEGFYNYKCENCVMGMRSKEVLDA